MNFGWENRNYDDLLRDEKEAREDRMATACKRCKEPCGAPMCSGCLDEIHKNQGDPEKRENPEAAPMNDGDLA